MRGYARTACDLVPNTTFHTEGVSMSVGTEQVVNKFLKQVPAHPRARSEVRRYTCSAHSLPVAGVDILLGAAAAAAAT